MSFLEIIVDHISYPLKLPHIINRSLGPFESAPQTASRMVHLFFAQFTRVPNTSTQTTLHLSQYVMWRNNNTQTIMSVVLSSWHGHCKRSATSFYQCRLSARYRYHPHPPSPFYWYCVCSSWIRQEQSWRDDFCFCTSTTAVVVAWFLLLPLNWKPDRLKTCLTELSSLWCAQYWAKLGIWLTELRFYHLTRNKTSHFRDVLPSQSLGLILKN